MSWPPNDSGPKLSQRARVFRFVLVAICVLAALATLADWATVAVLALIGGAWLAGTVGGFMIDEYWPDDPTARDWVPPRRTIVHRDPRRWW